jgi:hypothetical protein
LFCCFCCCCVFVFVLVLFNFCCCWTKFWCQANLWVRIRMNLVMWPWWFKQKVTCVPETFFTNQGVMEVQELCTPVMFINMFHFSRI